MTLSGTSGWPTAPSRIAVEIAELVDAGGGHHAAVFEVVLGAPVELGVPEQEVVAVGYQVEHLACLGHDLQPHTITGNDCDCELFHR